MNDQTTLSASIRPLINVPNAILAAMREELSLADVPWEATYGEYQSGGWLTAPLMNRTGRMADRLISDGSARSTELMSHFSKTKAYLDSLGLNIMCVRLANMRPGACLFEHVDYEELEEVPRLRLHIPITTNPEARLVFERESVHLSAGKIWMLDPKNRHASINAGLRDRVHLLIDCYRNPALDLLLGTPLEQFEVVPKPELSESVRAGLLRKANALLILGQFDLAEVVLLKTFHAYSVVPGSSYDLLIDLYEGQTEKNLLERKNSWLRKKSLYLGGTRD